VQSLGHSFNQSCIQKKKKIHNFDRQIADTRSKCRLTHVPRLDFSGISTSGCSLVNNSIVGGCLVEVILKLQVFAVKSKPVLCKAHRKTLNKSSELNVNRFLNRNIFKRLFIFPLAFPLGGYRNIGN